jgi:hypothetical protein
MKAMASTGEIGNSDDQSKWNPFENNTDEHIKGSGDQALGSHLRAFPDSPTQDLRHPA